MGSVVIGTAGHVDHGKTLLVKALTGTDTDRLEEEKRRGISIELGYARLELGPGRWASLVDVPGHERFVKTMVAGTTGIDLVMLVVAADEGVMPQTREHLDICRLLGVNAGLVAINKIDLVEPGRLEAVREEIVAEVKNTFLDGAPLVPVSAARAEGLEHLRAELDRLAREISRRASASVAYLPIDRVFSIRGFGTVVTGTLVSGTLAVDEQVDILPDRERRKRGVKIRGLQVHGKQVEHAEFGQRVAVNLAAPLESLSRGQVLATAGVLEAGRIFDVSLQLVPAAPPLRSGAKLILHAGTTHCEAAVDLFGGSKLEAGPTSFARLRCKDELVLLPGQHFILRGFVPLPGRGTTLGGGSVLAIFPPPSRQVPRSRRPEQLRTLASGTLEERLLVEMECALQRGLSLAELSLRVREEQTEVRRLVERLAGEGKLLALDGTFSHLVARPLAERLLSRTVELLGEFHHRQPLQPGMPVEQLRTSLRPAPEPRLFRRLVEEGKSSGRLSQEGNLLRLSSHRVKLEGSGRRLEERLLEIFERAGLAPPDPANAAEQLSAKPAEVVQLLHHLERSGSLLRLPGGMFISAGAVSGLRQKLIEHLERHGSITTQDFKGLVGGTRKYAIPLAEHFDREKITVRRGNLRVPGRKPG